MQLKRGSCKARNENLPRISCLARLTKTLLQAALMSWLNCREDPTSGPLSASLTPQIQVNGSGLVPGADSMTFATAMKPLTMIMRVKSSAGIFRVLSPPVSKTPKLKHSPTPPPIYQTPLTLPLSWGRLN